jgi:hypothetical protein
LCTLTTFILTSAVFRISLNTEKRGWTVQWQKSDENGTLDSVETHKRFNITHTVALTNPRWQLNDAVRIDGTGIWGGNTKRSREVALMALRYMEEEAGQDEGGLVDVTSEASITRSSAAARGWTFAVRHDCVHPYHCSEADERSES